MRKFIAILLAVAVVATTGGCSQIATIINKVQEGGERAASSDASSSEATDVGTAAEGHTEKLNAYIDAYNAVIGRFYDVLDDYVDEFGFEDDVYIEDGFSGFTLLTFNDYELKTVTDAVAYADAQPAMADADSAIKTLAPTVETLSMTLAEAKEYYDSKGYVDDNFAKAQEYHTAFLTQVDAFQAAWEPFSFAIDVLGQEADERNLRESLAEGRMAQYNALKLLLSAEAVSNELYKQEVSAVNILDLDMDAFKVVYDQLVADYDTLAAFAKDAEAIEAEGFSASTYEAYADAAMDVKAAASEIIQRVQNQEPVDDFYIENDMMLDREAGTPEKFGAMVDGLLSNYNSLMG